MSTRASWLLTLAPFALACQLVDPASGVSRGASGDGGQRDAGGHDVGSEDAGCGDATFCDDFDRETPIPSTGSIWQSVGCDPSATLAVDGALTIDYPSNDGTTYAACVLTSNPTAISVGSFQLDFDFDYAASGATASESMSYIVVASVLLTLPSANALGILDVNFQLLVDDQGEAQLLAVLHYPDAGRSPIPGNAYPSFALGQLYLPTPWLATSTACHVALSVDAKTPSGSGVATCAGKAISLDPADGGAPPGIEAPAVVALGYTHTSAGVAAPSFQLSYDDMVFRASP